MKYTPGPWEVSNSRRQIGKRAANGSLNLLADTTNSCFWEQDEANAHLIAAAPDLLEACKTLLRHIALAESNITPNDPEIVQAREAINKAERKEE